MPSVLLLTSRSEALGGVLPLRHAVDCRHTGEHVREAVDVVRNSDNGLGSVGKKVEEVQDSLEHAQVGFCI
jgi:hypothetical protein